ncbi:MAG TPA: hypothetical protein VIA45_02120 [Thermoanaerobaculia bacterium]|jgi:hypothetical protein
MKGLAPLWLLAAAPAFASAAPASTPSSPASVTTFGRDLVVSQPVSGRVLAAFASVRLEAPVAGDVIVWGGDVSFGPGGAVGGNLSVFGGSVRAAGTPPVRGVVSTPGSLLRLYLAEMRRAPWETPPSATVWGLRLLALAAWLAAAIAALFFFDTKLPRAAARASETPTLALLAGVLSIVTLFLAAAAVLALLPAPLAVPLALFVAAVAVAAKVFGMVALFLMIGQSLSGRVAARQRPAALALGFAILGGVSLLPLAGPLVWSLASVLAVGIAFTTRFGAPRYRVAIA